MRFAHTYTWSPLTSALSLTQMQRLHRSVFIADLKAAFPELRAQINAEHGLLHLETSAFARLTQTAIDSGDRPKLQKCFDIATKYLLHGDSRVQNAIGVSFVEHIEVRSQKVDREWIWDFMSAPLKKEFEAFHGKREG